MAQTLKTKLRAAGITVLLAVTGMAGGFVGSRVGAGGRAPAIVERADAAPSGPSSPLLKETSENFRAVAKKVGPAVVVIKASQEARAPRGYQSFRHGRRPHAPSPDEEDEPGYGYGYGGNPFEDFLRGFPGFRNFGAPPPEGGRGSGQSLGSGFVIDKRGFILTNNHVVDGATKIVVALPDDESTDIPATVVGRDPKTDLAVIKIAAKKDLPVAEWADSDGVEVGDWAVAIGSPFMLSHSVTAGIVSAKGRNGSNVMGADYGADMIQTDAAINPGNSGGPLCALDGKVMGVNTAILSQSGGFMGIGFAIPANTARAIAENLIKDGKITRGWLGVAIQKADKDLLAELKAPGGVVINQVQGESPAVRAGLNPGDVIVEADGRPIKDAAELQKLIGQHKPGDSVTLKMISYQDKKSQAIRVRLGELPGAPSPRA